MELLVVAAASSPPPPRAAVVVVVVFLAATQVAVAGDAVVGRVRDAVGRIGHAGRADEGADAGGNRLGAEGGGASGGLGRELVLAGLGCDCLVAHADLLLGVSYANGLD